MTRPTEELQTITDCVEEVLFLVTHHVNIVGLIQIDPQEYPGNEIYNGVEAILKRAQELPRLAAPDS